MSHKELIPGFEIQRIHTRKERLGYARIVRTDERRNLFHILDESADPENEEVLTLFHGIEKAGGLAVYDSDDCEKPLSEGNKMRHAEMGATRYARLRDICCAIRENAAEIIPLADEVPEQFRQQYTCSVEQIIRGEAVSRDVDWTLGNIYIWLKGTKRRKMYQVFDAINRSVPRFHEQHWLNGSTVLSIGSKILHELYPKRKNTVTFNDSSMWHVDTLPSDPAKGVHMLHQPHGKRKMLQRFIYEFAALNK